MSEKDPVPKPQQPEGQPEGELAGEPPPRPSARPLLAKLAALLLVVAIVIAECLTAYFYFPSPSQTAAMAGADSESDTHAASPAPTPAHEKQGHGRHGKEKRNAKGKKDSKEAPGQVEVDLGEYSVTAAHAPANATLQITFHLYGTVAAVDEQEFQELKKENEHRFREQVLVTVRAANISDLTDAGLGLLKRNILEKTNHLLGKPILQSVIFSDFVFVEQ